MDRYAPFKSIPKKRRFFFIVLFIEEENLKINCESRKIWCVEPGAQSHNIQINIHCTFFFLWLIWFVQLTRPYKWNIQLVECCYHSHTFSSIWIITWKIWYKLWLLSEWVSDWLYTAMLISSSQQQAPSLYTHYHHINRDTIVKKEKSKVNHWNWLMFYWISWISHHTYTHGELCNFNAFFAGWNR